MLTDCVMKHTQSRMVCARTQEGLFRKTLTNECQKSPLHLAIFLKITRPFMKKIEKIDIFPSLNAKTMVE